MSLAASYRPGQWFGIFGEHATVVLPPSEKARVGRIWAMVDDGAGFDEVLDALIADGLRALPGFVLVSESDGRTKVVIRGPARAEFVTDAETVTVEGSAVTTWAERSLDGVRSMRIDVADDGGADDLAIRDGLVRVARVDRPAYAGEGPVTDEVTPARVPVVDDEPAPAVDQALDETAYFPQDPGHDGLTQAGNWHVGEVARGLADASDQPVTPDPQPPVARLTFSSGEVVDVDRVVVVGRAPEATRSSAEQPRLVAVPSPSQEISSTHVEIRPGEGADQGSAVVTDLGSTNGTTLQQPGLPPEDLRPGVPVRLVPGAIIDLGDGVTIQVVHP